MRLSEVLKGIPTLAVLGGLEIEVSGLSASSSIASPSTVFFALRGFSRDGHDFVPDAIKSGASAVVLDRKEVLADVNRLAHDGRPTLILVEDSHSALSIAASTFFGNPTEHLNLIGIVGTNGKTSVSYLLGSILGLSSAVGVIGTISYRYPGRKEQASLTTPDPVSLQRLLSEMRDKHVRYVLLETSSHGLAQRRVDGCRFKMGIFTNITREHLDFHGTFEDYMAAKLSFFERHLDPSVSPDATAVVNLDDAHSDRFLKASKVKTLTFSTSKEGADFLATRIRLSADGSAFEVKTEDGAFEVKTSLIGAHAVENCLAAIAAATALGQAPEQIVAGIASLGGVPGRFEKVSCGQDFLVVVDFAHTPDAFAKTMAAARGLISGRIISVFGAGGDRDTAKRAQMGRIAAESSDLCIVTSDNPRTEDPLSIIHQIEQGARSVAPAEVLVEPDRRKAIALALSRACAADVVLILGKGHEPYQIIGTTRYPFDDRMVARELLFGMGYNLNGGTPL
ncbi:MAG: UDP-N-acetylmuramoyl-L-alanyl-D-glutamate--2,6-diaminopimelate ligase [Candidatus Coatesbacteria bacterium]|nr:UDP-N-acetylmuramoyl-L-alanyl-D-glutamate--2,6-diaminopimelate ligase [Candidatus Coatesbacteria bacterium]